jgi:hypothetical protein
MHPFGLCWRNAASSSVFPTVLLRLAQLGGGARRSRRFTVGIEKNVKTAGGLAFVG